MAFLFSLNEFSNAQSTNQYSWLHQTPQGNTIRWVKMWDANNWYAAGLGGNFMKTTNGGSTWNFSDFVGGFSSTGIYNTIYDGHFFNLNNGFLCGGSGKVYKTTNAGASWDSTT
ncbi:MAG TPA: hypothetical protein VK004_01120, partial [Ignavibacteria bacterium]|nr:hypothetical protein [Ignavibacteria bacterium]